MERRRKHDNVLYDIAACTTHQVYVNRAWPLTCRYRISQRGQNSVYAHCEYMREDKHAFNLTVPLAVNRICILRLLLLHRLLPILQSFWRSLPDHKLPHITSANCNDRNAGIWFLHSPISSLPQCYQNLSSCPFQPFCPPSSLSCPDLCWRFLFQA